MELRKLRDRRVMPRERVSIPALIRGWRPRTARAEEASLEELSPGGMRISSALELHRDDVVVVTRRDAVYEPLYARIVWSDRQGLIRKGPLKRWGTAWLAGCALLEAPPGGSAPGTAGIGARTLGTGVRWLIWLALLAGAIGVVGLICYVIGSIVSIFLA